LVDKALVVIVVDVEVAVNTPLDAELLPIERTRSFKEKLVPLVHELEVAQVPFLLLPTILLGLRCLWLFFLLFFVPLLLIFLRLSKAASHFNINSL
jgi:hypothetical protein